MNAATNTSNQTGNLTLVALQERVNAEYAKLAKAGQKAAFVRRLKESNLPLLTVARKNSQPDQLITELRSMPVENQQARIDEIYSGFTKAADKASFSRRLKAASLPVPSPKKVASEQDRLIAELQAQLGAAVPAATPVKTGKPKAA